jgi:L-seryl-tRNA(Ser) seleniumtransferase
MIGFTEQPSADELVGLGRRHRIPVMEDLGNGLLVNLAGAGIEGEHGLHDSLSAGVDVVCVSGDKLLGGPQAGVVAGRKELIKRIRSNPLFRALRVDKLTYAALEATLLAYVRQDYDAIPALRMIYATADEIRTRTESFVERLGLVPETKIEIIEGRSVIGGGTAPTKTIPTFVIALSSDRYTVEQLQERLRTQTPPVIARIEEDRLMLDLRTVFKNEESALGASIRAACGFAGTDDSISEHPKLSS